MIEMKRKERVKFFNENKSNIKLQSIRINEGKKTQQQILSTKMNKIKVKRKKKVLDVRVVSRHSPLLFLSGICLLPT